MDGKTAPAGLQKLCTETCDPLMTSTFELERCTGREAIRGAGALRSFNTSATLTLCVSTIS